MGVLAGSDEQPANMLAKSDTIPQRAGFMRRHYVKSSGLTRILLRTAVASGAAELLFDAEEAIVLGHPLGAGRRAGLDLTATGGDRQVGNEGVLGLARA